MLKYSDSSLLIIITHTKRQYLILITLHSILNTYHLLFSPPFSLSDRQITTFSHYLITTLPYLLIDKSTNRQILSFPHSLIPTFPHSHIPTFLSFSPLQQPHNIRLPVHILFSHLFRYNQGFRSPSI